MCAQWLVRGFLIVWAVSLTAVGACLMVSHWVPLPNSNPAVLAQLEGFTDFAHGRWAAFHFLYAECPCSRRVLEHLLERCAHRGIAEQIVLIGGDPDLAARGEGHGFVVDHVAPEQLKGKYGLETAPLLAVVDPQNRVRYAGGYTARKQGFEIRDLTIIGDLLAGKNVESLPVYGCAVSKSLQSIVDPLGIKPSSRD